MYHLVLAVVEAKRVPCRVLASSGIGVEVLVDRAVEASDAFVFVLYSVAVDDVHDYGYAALVGVVDEFLEFFWSAETARGSEEARHMVAERAVIRVFLNGHDLNCIVAVALDTGQDVASELLVCADTLFFLRHAYVAFVYQQGSGVGFEVFVVPYK